MNIFRVRNLTDVRLLTLLSLLVIPTVAPLIKNQFISGAIINACLLISTSLLGMRRTWWLAVVPSLVALSTGLLPLVLAPLVPFIMMANILFIGVFKLLSKKNFWIGTIAAALAKFTFLALISGVFVSHFLPLQAVSAAGKMLSWTQLVTALVGGIIAWGGLYWLHKTGLFSRP